MISKTEFKLTLELSSTGIFTLIDKRNDTPIHCSWCTDIPPEKTVIAGGALKRTKNDNGDGANCFEFGLARNGKS